MRLLSGTAVLCAIGAAVLAAPLAGTPAAKPRLVSNPAAHVGARWTGVAVAHRAPSVRASLGRRSQRVAVRRVARGRYQLRAVFPAPGRWVLRAGSARFGTVLVRRAALRLTNAADIAVEPGGTLLVVDLSNRVFRLAGERLTLVAGNGRPGRSGDGGPATRAAVGFPVEVAVDPRGGFGVVHDERWIRHVDTTGRIRTVAELAQPTALAYDPAGNLFVSELGGRVQRIGADGSRATYGGFNGPHGLDTAPDGTVYVCDTFNNRIQRIAPDGSVSTLASGLNTPVDLDVGPDGNVYVADFGGNRVLRVTPAGAVAAVADGLAGTNAVAIGSDGSIYVTERGRAAVRRIAPRSFAALAPAVAGRPWTGTVKASRRPAVVARNGVTSVPVAVRPLGRQRYRLRTTFPFSGRWQLRTGRRRLGAVDVRPGPPLASALPTARASRVCGGAGLPYPQYALSRDPTTGALWVACQARGLLHRISPATGETRAILRSQTTPFSIAAGFGSVWTVERSPVLYRIDTRTGRPALRGTGHGFPYVWAAAGSIWAADDPASLLFRYDPRSGRDPAFIATGNGTSALVEAGGGVWILNHRDGTLQRVDLTANTAVTLARLPGDAPERMDYAEGSLWVTGRGTDLLRVDPQTGAVQATIEIGAGAIDVRAAAHSIWVAAPTDEEDRRGNPFLDRVLRIDPATNSIVETIRPAARVVVTGTASTGDAFWLADTVGGRLYRFTR